MQVNKVPVTIAQTTALPAHQAIQQQVSQQPIAVSQQPIAVSQQSGGVPPQQISGPQQIPGPQQAPPPPPQMMQGKQRNDSMSSENSYTMGPQFQQQRHSLTHMQVC